MFENPRRGRQARNFTTNVPKILVLKSSSEQIFPENGRWVPLTKASKHSVDRQTFCCCCCCFWIILYFVVFKVLSYKTAEVFLIAIRQYLHELLHPYQQHLPLKPPYWKTVPEGDTLRYFLRRSDWFFVMSLSGGLFTLVSTLHNRNIKTERQKHNSRKEQFFPYVVLLL